jgi:hypothetical protein
MVSGLTFRRRPAAFTGGPAVGTAERYPLSQTARWNRFLITGHAHTAQDS